MPEVAAEPAVLRLVIFALARQRYGLALSTVERVLQMVAVSPLPGCPDAILGVINVHGAILPVVDLRRRLGLPLADYGPEASLLLVRTPHRMVALPVDEVIGVVELPEECVVEPDRVASGVVHVSGIATLADGVLLIQDPDALLSVDEEQELTESLLKEHH